MPKKEAYYFSHDSNSRNDPKMLRLRSRLKMEGYGLYWCLIEMLRDDTDFRLPLDYEAIAFGLHVDSGLVERVINEFELFTVEKDYFYSESLIRRMKERSERGKKGAEARWNKKAEIQENQPEQKPIPKNNPDKKLDFEEIKLSFESQKLLNKPYFIRMQELHSMPEKEVMIEFDKWKLKNESNAFNLKHAENSFNIWLGKYKEIKNGTKKTGKPPKQNGANQLSSIHQKISGSYK